jgi:predicted XRE-type DNA-binding protein
MKPKITAIPLTNSAAGLIRDTIAHHGITQAEAAEAMKVSKAQLSDVIRQKKAARHDQIDIGFRCGDSSWKLF